MKTSSKIKEISSEEADKLLDPSEPTGKYEPRGLFFLCESKTYIGIDNSTGDAWTEAFPNKTSCLKWLDPY